MNLRQWQGKCFGDGLLIFAWNDFLCKQLGEILKKKKKKTYRVSSNLVITCNWTDLTLFSMRRRPYNARLCIQWMPLATHAFEAASGTHAHAWLNRFAFINYWKRMRFIDCPPVHNSVVRPSRPKRKENAFELAYSSEMHWLWLRNGIYRPRWRHERISWIGSKIDIETGGGWRLVMQTPRCRCRCRCRCDETYIWYSDRKLNCHFSKRFLMTVGEKTWATAPKMI